MYTNERADWEDDLRIYQGPGGSTMAVATIEADEAVASSVFVQIMGTSLKNLLVRVILVIFGHFALSDFKVWLRWWAPHHYQRLVYTNEHAGWEDDLRIYQGPGGSTTSLSVLAVH